MDPIRYEAGDVNLYRALGNGLPNRLDPSGLLPPDPPWPINQAEREAEKAYRERQQQETASRGSVRLFGENWVAPWSENAAGFWDTLHAYGRATVRAVVGTVTGALAGAGTGALAGGATGFVVTGGPGVLPGAGAGAVGGAIWGGVSGLARAAFANDVKEAAIGGAQAGAVGGAGGGAVRAYGAVRALGTSSKLVASAKDLADPNAIHHVWGQSKHLLDPILAKYGSEQAAYKALQDVVVRELTRKGTTAGQFRIEILFEGHRMIVKSTIINNEVRIGTAYIPRTNP